MDLTNLEASIKKSRRFAVLVVAFGVMLYMVWFVGINNQQLSVSGSDWGTFGDTVGGLANPLIAYLALYWLTQSILVQKHELEETRAALKESHQFQASQADSNKRSTELQTFNLKLAAINAKISVESEYLRYVLEFGSQNGTQYSVLSKDGQKTPFNVAIQQTQQSLATLYADQDRLIQAMENL